MPAAGAPDLRVALTFDDLGASPERASPALSARILDALRVADAPSAVFVNCKSLDDDALRLWQRAGAAIGNHTTTHRSVDETGPDEAWWTDVRSCDARLRSVVGAPVRYFRFPFLRYGKTVADRDRAASQLASLGYAIAHVTAATSEWLLAKDYDEAVARGDAALEKEIVAAYVEHMRETLDAARAVARDKTGGEVAQITLFHVNGLAADHLTDVLVDLRGAGWRFVSLDEALADPVYARPDAYAGGCGCSWLARIPPALTRDDPYVFGDLEDALHRRFDGRLERE